MIYKGNSSEKIFRFKFIKIAVIAVFVFFVFVYGSRAVNRQRESLAEQEVIEEKIKSELLEVLRENDFSDFRDFVFYVNENYSYGYLEEVKHNVLFYRSMVSKSIEI